MNSKQLKVITKKATSKRDKARAEEEAEDKDADQRRIKELLKEFESEAKKAAAEGDDFVDIQIWESDGVPEHSVNRDAYGILRGGFDPKPGSILASVVSTLKKRGFKTSPHAHYHDDYEDSYTSYDLRVEWT